MRNEINWIELLFNVFLASFGGIVNKLVDQEKNPRKRIKFGRYLISAVISLFIGIAFYFVCKHYEAPMYATLVITMMSGFAGTPALYWLWSRIKKQKGDNEIVEKGE